MISQFNETLNNNGKEGADIRDAVFAIVEDRHAKILSEQTDAKIEAMKLLPPKNQRHLFDAAIKNLPGESDWSADKLFLVAKVLIHILCLWHRDLVRHM